MFSFTSPMLLPKFFRTSVLSFILKTTEVITKVRFVGIFDVERSSWANQSLEVFTAYL